jgi:hypothetical protein
MYFAVAVLLVALWLFGVLTSITLGGFIHILFVVAFAAVVFKILGGPEII